ncbi:MAG TPA: DUF3857 domain-containing protein [Candidatus Binatus sp.]|nr:DUF3857 domain-containing protein [Candidatus Binatus sp.]
MLRWLLGLLPALCLCSPLFQARTAIEDTPKAWNLPRFAAEAAKINETAAKASVRPGTDVVVLDEESSYVFDADGKSVRTEYLVYKVLTQNGAEGWDAISVDWEPWHAERPTLRARVITPDNAIHTLDAKTITDGPALDENEKTYGDGRIVRAPLPAIAVGSVVEEEEVMKESAPMFGAGIVAMNYFGRNVPVEHSKLTLDAPASLPLRYATKLLPDVKPQKSETNGRTQIVFEQGPMDALDEIETYLPADVPARPEVRFSTGASWQAIAEGYGKIVDEKAAAKDVQTLVNGLVSGKTTRDERASAIMQYLSREIRYTGVEFGEAAIIPRAPGETLRQRYGDCKDKATLAVAMLRAAGVPAYVALLNAGARHDVEADLPGMGQFDHAIVYAPGTPDFWIDATAEYARLGQLPQVDQGRLALVARKESTGLLAIPEASSEENKIVEQREFYLAENGPTRVVETTQALGVFESEFRASYAGTNVKDIEKGLKEYIGNEYASEKLARWERTDPRDMSKPFQLVVEATDARRGFTDLDNAVAAIRVDSLFYKLPDELARREKQPERGAEEGKDKPKKLRTADYQLPEAFQYELRYKIDPPEGFQAKPVPPDTKINMGPARVVEKFSTGGDGAVVADLQFDTGKRRLTVSEAAELRNKVAQLREGPMILIYFEPTTQTLLNQGKIREAFQASRDLIGRHPKEAVRHLQRAKVLLAAGMGQAAREEAQTAVKLEPGSALAQKTLAEILEYDLVGRQFRHGSDYAGAEAAFRAAEKLDASDHATVANLAILLEHNSWGLRYGPGAKLKEAIAEYRKLKPETLTELGVQNNLAFALFYAGEFAEAMKIAQDLNPRPTALLVACEAAINGPQAGLAEARKRTSGEEQFKEVARTAGQLLENLRLYVPAADLLEAGAAGTNATETASDAVLLRKTQLHERMSFTDDPAGLAIRFYVLQSGPNFTLEQLRSLCSRNGKETIGTADIATAIQTGRKATTSWKSRAGLFSDVGIDLSVTRAQPKVEGDDVSGYKVTLWNSAEYRGFNYLVKEDGAYKVLATREQPWGIGLEALDRVAAGNISGARTLLDWLRADRRLVGGDDPLSSPPFTRIWKKGKEASEAEIKVAAAALLVETEGTAARGLAVLEAEKDSASGEPEKLNVDLALMMGYLKTEDYEKVVVQAADLAKQYPESQLAFQYLGFGLRVVGRVEEARRLADDRLQRNPGDVDAMRELVSDAIRAGNYPEAHALAQKIRDAGKAEPADLNLIAWNSLFAGKVERSDLEDALKATQLSPKSYAILHTLACVYAEAGKTKEAREVLVQAMDSLNLDEPDDNYWYALGRVAEQYGEFETARADYMKVTKPKPIFIPDSSYELAQMRLAAMKDGDAKASR